MWGAKKDWGQAFRDGSHSVPAASVRPGMMVCMSGEPSDLVWAVCMSGEPSEFRANRGIFERTV